MKSRRKRVEEKTGCCPVEVRAFETPLSKCLILDPYPESGAIHDVDPFGVYQNRSDGAVVFKQVIRCRPDYVPCPTPNDLDALIAKVFLAATRHGRRHMVITEYHMTSFLSRSMGGNIFSGSPLPNGVKSHVVPGIPANVILCVDAEHPEDLGKLCYSCGKYGVSLMSPHLVKSLEVVPRPFGYGHSEDAVVG